MRLNETIIQIGNGRFHEIKDFGNQSHETYRQIKDLGLGLQDNLLESFRQFLKNNNFEKK